MAACFVCNAQDTRLIEIPQFPHFKKSEKYEIAKQIARHLKRLVKQTGNGQPTAIKVPSAMELSTFYHCTPLDVLDGLYAFRSQEYDYAMQGLDSQIILYGPRVGMKPDKVLPEWLYPWECTHKLTENPLSQALPNKGE